MADEIRLAREQVEVIVGTNQAEARLARAQVEIVVRPGQPTDPATGQGLLALDYRKFSNISWNKLDKLDYVRMQQMQVNDEETYLLNLKSSGGVLGFEQEENNIELTTFSTYTTLMSVDFTCLANRQIMFNFFCPRLVEGATTGAEPIFKFYLDTVADSNFRVSNINNISTSTDGGTVSFHVLRTNLQSGAHTLEIKVKNNSSTPTGESITFNATTTRPMKLWAEDKGVNRQYA